MAFEALSGPVSAASFMSLTLASENANAEIHLSDICILYKDVILAQIEALLSAAATCVPRDSTTRVELSLSAGRLSCVYFNKGGESDFMRHDFSSLSFDVDDSSHFFFDNG
jgi:hypothetical protein